MLEVQIEYLSTLFEEVYNQQEHQKAYVKGTRDSDIQGMYLNHICIDSKKHVIFLAETGHHYPLIEKSPFFLSIHYLLFAASSIALLIPPTRL